MSSVNRPIFGMIIACYGANGDNRFLSMATHESRRGECGGRFYSMEGWH
jgi:hypothetical protein